MHCSLLVSAASVNAQAPAASRWKGSVEANGSLLYGAANQRLVSGGLGVGRADRQYELRFDAITAYGDTRDAETGRRQLTARNSRVSSSYDLHPHDRVSPFAFGSAETNYQQRIRSRLSLGVGAKLTIWRPDSVIGGFVQDASVSLAVLGEATRALANAPATTGAAVGNHARWSLRARYRRRIGENVRFTHVTLYQPTVDRFTSYTLEAVTELAVPLRSALQLTLSHRERLDSEAKRRGAPSIEDGQLLFGVRATF